ncbi:TMEM14 family protein [Singulisphaera sp. Ch08]|uniref:TMEM14 family protein n=1 Tax=Singulisphaera sp. Ch08 TaxID=3120278 RepID=A0AAU7CH85_9BACT
MHPLVGHVTLGIYAVLLAMGGIMGFVKARSRPSLIAGLVSAAAAVVALVLSVQGNDWGRPLGLFLAVFLFVFFGYRYALRARVFMPNGLMAVVSLGVVVILIVWTVIGAPAPAQPIL